MKATRPPLQWIVAIVTLLMAIWLCWQCIDIWQDGNAPENLDADGLHLKDVYTAEKVAERLSPLWLALPAYTVLILGAMVAGNAPQEPLPLPAENRLTMMKRSLPQGTPLPAAALREEKLRRGVGIAVAAGVLGCAIPAGIFLLDGRNFVSWNLETVLGTLLAHVLPWTAEALGLIWAGEELIHRSMARECAVLKSLPKGKMSPAQEKAFPVGAVRVLLAGVAIVFIVLGVMNGGLYDVLVKAINICTECIGLG